MRKKKTFIKDLESLNWFVGLILGLSQFTTALIVQKNTTHFNSDQKT